MNDKEQKSIEMAINDGDVKKAHSLIDEVDDIGVLLDELKVNPIKDEDLLQQIDLVLNFDKNRGNHIDKIKNLFRMYNKILKDYTSRDFKLSLLESEIYLNSIELKGTVPYVSPYILEKSALNSLKKDDANSFLIIPVHSNCHTFSVVVRRIEEGFSATVVNRDNEAENYRKSDERYYGQFEEYLFKEKNTDKLLEVLNGPRLSDPVIADTNSIYQNFRKQCDKRFMLNIQSRVQVKGNCFIKEPESAIQFAFSTRNFSTKKLKDLRTSTIKFKPKWEPSTKEIRRRYIECQIEDNPHLKDQIENKYNKYIKEKMDRVIVSHARRGDLEKVKELINKKANINALDPSNHTALMWASLNGHIDVAKKLIKNNARLDIVNNKGWTALHIAALAGNKDIVKEIIKAGADIDAKGSIGETPIYLAAKNGHLNTVKQLIKEGAELVNSQRLNYIFGEGHLEVVREFVNNGVLVDSNSLIFSAAGGHLEVFNEFVNKGFDINTKEKETKRTALMYASRNGHTDMVRELVKNGADIHLKDNDGTTALIWASGEGHVKVVKELIKNGANIDIKDDFTVSATIAAARKGHVDVLKELLGNYGDVNLRDNAGMNVLMWSAFIGNEESVKDLINKGVEVNLCDKIGRTALSAAAQKAHINVVKYLMTNDADVNIQDYEGRTPLMYALKNGHDNNAYRKGAYIEIVKELIANGADIGMKDRDGKTAIDYANIQEVKQILTSKKILAALRCDLKKDKKFDDDYVWINKLSNKHLKKQAKDSLDSI